jgi:hypothetical protein
MMVERGRTPCPVDGGEEKVGKVVVVFVVGITRPDVNKLWPFGRTR